RPFVDALEVPRLLAVHLYQGDDYLERLVLRLDEAENLRALDVETSGAGEEDLVAGIHAHDADVLARRLGAVSRTARDCHLDLRRRPRAPHELLDANAGASRIMRAEAAPIGADACLHGTQALSVSVARNEAGLAEIG